MRGRVGGQQGFLNTAQIVFFIAVGTWIVLAVKLAPLFIEHYQIKSALQALEKEPNLAQMSAREIWNALEKRLDVNYVANTIKKEHLRLARRDGRLTVQIVYEGRRNLFGNLDAALRFDDSIEASVVR